jgi:Amt family ammonium transporter
MKFKAWLAFVPLWITIVYVPISHWVWGGGWLAKIGALDFAGGTVVHLDCGIAALVLCIYLGTRKDTKLLPHHLGYSVLGAALLWFGWFGFNAGSALTAGGLASSAFLVTNTATAAAMISWMIIDIIKTGKPTVLGAITGAVCGLVAITPASGYVTVTGALILGFITSIFSYYAMTWLKPRFGYDDSLDVFAVHGVSGAWGAIATGLFAAPFINPLGVGLFYGNPMQMVWQLIDILTVVAWSGGWTLVLAFVLDKTIGLRVTPEEELEGLDTQLHEESGYRI